MIDDDPEPDADAQAFAKAALRWLGYSVPAACLPGVVLNLDILQSHMTIVCSSDAACPFEIEEVFSA